MKHLPLPAAIFVFLLASAAGPGAVAIAQAQDRPAVAPSNPVAAQSLEQLSTILDHPAVFTEPSSTRAAACTSTDRAGCRAARAATSTTQPGPLRCRDGW